jgi:hypothetical protein
MVSSSSLICITFGRFLLYFVFCLCNYTLICKQLWWWSGIYFHWWVQQWYVCVRSTNYRLDSDSSVDIQYLWWVDVKNSNLPDSTKHLAQTQVAQDNNDAVYMEIFLRHKVLWTNNSPTWVCECSNVARLIQNMMLFWHHIQKKIHKASS